MPTTKHNSPVDEPPGKDGTQGQAHPDEKFPVPDYEPGTNPPGTNPPVEPAQDPATTPVPGSVPTFSADPDPAMHEKPATEQTPAQQEQAKRAHEANVQRDKDAHPLDKDAHKK